MPTDALDLLLTRRSARAALLAEPGPSPHQLRKMLTAAARVPDHKKLVPWRFIVFEGGARAAFGDVLAAACQAEEKEAPSPVRLETERKRFLRAPTVVCVVSRTVESAGAPEWEQILSCGAAAMNLVLAANAQGFATAWITEWCAYSPAVARALGLGPNERIAGFVYIGTPVERQADRERPDLDAIVTRWQP